MNTKPKKKLIEVALPLEAINRESAWYDIHPSVRKLAADRARQYHEHDVEEIIKKIVKDDLQYRGDFERIHDFPQSGADVSDDKETRLVVFGPEHPCKKEDKNPALDLAKQILDQRGSAQRLYKNALVFVAPDDQRLVELKESARLYLAWDQDAFAYADLWDDNEKRYKGLCAGEHKFIDMDSTALIVKPEVAREQFKLDTGQNNRKGSKTNESLKKTRSA
jgi:hypothetical protein